MRRNPPDVEIRLVPFWRSLGLVLLLIAAPGLIRFFRAEK
jgi:hypothetical protein